VFQPAITYTVPPGWTNMEDLPGNFWLYRASDPQVGALGGSYLGIYQNARASAISCAEAPQDGVGPTPRDLVKWFQSIPGLLTSKPKPVTVGGLEGLQIDFSLPPGNKTCTFDGNSGIPLIIGNGVSSFDHAILHQLDVRLVILSWNGGNVTVEITNLRTQASAAAYRAAVQPVIGSLKFG
jgi:hypothetical protein